MRLFKKYNDIGFVMLIMFFLSAANLFSQSVDKNPEFLSLKALPNDSAKIIKVFRFVESIVDTIPVESRIISEYGLAISKEINFKKGEALFNNIIGISYYNVSEAAYAMEYYLKAISIYEPLLKENDSDEQLKKFHLQTQNNIAILYSDLENYSEALKYFSNCLQYSRNVNDETMIVVYLNNVGRILILSGKYEEGRKNLNEAIKISEKNGYNRAKAFALSNLAELEKILKNYNLALANYLEANKFYGLVGEKYEVANNYYEIAKIYILLKDYQNSSKFAELLSSQTDLLEDTYMKRAIYYINAENEFAKGNYKSAYNFRVLYENAEDSIEKDNKDKDLKYIKVQQELFKIEKENQALQKESEIYSVRLQNKNLIFALIILILITLALIFILKFRHGKKVSGILKDKYNQIEEQRNSLNASNALKDKLFSIISHDLRTPFVTLLGYSEILKTDYDILTEQDKIEFIDSIYSASKSTFYLLENILFWSRSQRNELKTDLNNFDIKESLKEVFLLAEQWAAGKNVSLAINIPDGLTVHTDKQMLNIITRNLLNNAIKYSDKNSSVTVNAEKENNFLKVSIKDSGVGMSSDQFLLAISDEIIKPSAGTNNEMGTGFGLKLCNELIAKLNGQFFINPENNIGTEIILVIPSE